jgi:lipid II:glycine glycyltransferase (peptidoglycan interpeptide bridge formation enzyme)
VYRKFSAKDKVFEQALQSFYQLLQDTAKRDKFGVHAYDYYEKLLQKLYPHCRLYLAYQNDIVLAGIIAVFYGQTATYYYGASGSIARETMATYGLQWQVISEAKQEGYSMYDFLGIAPDEAKSNHPWRGVTDFKKKFGGSVYSYAGTFHFVLKPLLYLILNVSKTILQTRKTFSR